MNKKIAIIGTGIAGLNCAKQLEKNPNITIDMYEKKAAIGGRIQTDEVDGFLLDHGFQVFLSKYPEAMKAFDYDKLDLCPFKAGAKINGHYVGDPIREPRSLPSTIFAPIGSIKDKLLILKMRLKHPTPKKHQTALEFLRDYGFSERIIDNFFKPFFSGVFLNNELENSAHFFLFLYQIFATDYATLPKSGMQELPRNLANQLKRTNIHLLTSVKMTSSESLSLPNGEVKKYDHIIKAYPTKDTAYYSVTTDYFWTNKIEHPPISPVLELFTQTKHINHVAPISLANPQYAPRDRLLLSVNSLNESTVEEVTQELTHLYPEWNLTFLKRYMIKEALPKMKQKISIDNSIIRCGDFLESPSINGALASGRKAAETLLNKI
jgi:hypothetical protein